MSEKKVILFIVEGPLDRYFYKEYSDGFIKSVFPDNLIEYSITNGDILTTYNHLGIKISVESEVNKALDEDKFEIKNIIYIAHLCDVDGCYLEDTDFLVDTKGTLNYGQNYKYVNSNKKIYVSDINYRDKLIATWKTKKNNQENLIQIDTILGVKYRLYYNSLFLEHFLTGRTPYHSEDKRDCIDDFFEQISDHSELEAFITEKMLSVDYTESWDELKNPINKMTSSSNLNIFFDDIRSLIKPD